MNDYKCEYCGNTFSRTTNLRNHQKRAKYCLAIQEQGVCKEYEDKNVLLGELAEKDKLIKKYEKHIQKLEDRIERLATKAMERPTTSRTKNTFNNINLTPLTTEHIQEYLPNLTREHIEAGSAGYARFAVDYPLKDSLVCVDHARKKWRFKNKHGEIVDDYEGQIATEKFFQAIVDRNEELIKDYVDELMLLSQEAGETDKVIKLYRKITDLNDINFRCNDTANGKDTEFKWEFIRDVTKLLGRIKIEISK